MGPYVSSHADVLQSIPPGTMSDTAPLVLGPGEEDLELGHNLDYAIVSLQTEDQGQGLLRVKDFSLAAALIWNIVCFTDRNHFTFYYFTISVIPGGGVVPPPGPLPVCCMDSCLGA